jgi:hypothetical protein
MMGLYSRFGFEKIPGLDIRVAKRAIKSSGSKMTWVVPSLYGVFSW